MDVLRQNSQSRYSRTRQDLIKALYAIVNRIEDRVIIFLDALDESEDFLASADLIRQLETVSKVQICASSRPERLFVAEFDGDPQIRLQDVNQRDIEKLINSKFSQNRWVKDLARRAETEKALKDLTESVAYKAEGACLWVHLVIQNLLHGVMNRDDISTLADRVRQLPSDMYQLYKAMLQRWVSKDAVYAAEAALYLNLVLHTEELHLFAFLCGIDDTVRQRLRESLPSNTAVQPSDPEQEFASLER